MKRLAGWFRNHLLLERARRPWRLAENLGFAAAPVATFLEQAFCQTTKLTYRHFREALEASNSHSDLSDGI